MPASSTISRLSLAELPWSLRQWGDPSGVPPACRGIVVPAHVPGCVHTDLIRAGLIGHPSHGRHEETSEWVGSADWRYECSFVAPSAMHAHERLAIHFDCLDTVARVDLNGETIGRAASEFIPWRFDAKPAIRSGRNTLAVTFTSARRHAGAESARLGPRPVNGDWAPYNMIRKCASSFQWDWGPRVATCGISGPVLLEAWSGPRIETVRAEVAKTANDRWEVRAHTTFSGACAGSVLCAELMEAEGAVIARAETEVHATGRPGAPACAVLTVERPRLWNPRGHGAPNLYRLEVRAVRADGHELGNWHGRVGFRTIGLRTDGGAFAFHVNDRPIFCQGANWIPEGLFPQDRACRVVRARVRDAAEAGMNMLRVWGGGRYESEAFYLACDELGLLVWQDFMFACACYPEEEPLGSLIEHEARHQIARLQHHPCVALWCGGNENTWAYESWGFKERLTPGQTWGRGIWLERLPRLVAELDATRPYRPDSPWSDDESAHPNDPARGDRHTWDTWGDGYRAQVPGFCSEFGQQSPPSWATLREAGMADATVLDRTEFARRQRGPGGMERWFGGPLKEWFDTPRDDHEWHALTSILQARSLSIAIDWLRVNRPRCAGALVWQLNDAWPGPSWSLIDSSGRRKPAWHAFRRSCRPRTLCFHEVAGELVLYAVNDTDEQWRSHAAVRRWSLCSEPHPDGDIRVDVPPRSARRLHVWTDARGIVDACAGAARVNGPSVSAVWSRPTDLRLPDLIREAPSIELQRLGDESWSVVIRSERPLVDLLLPVDRLNPRATASDQCFAVLPEERTIVRVDGVADLSADALRSVAFWLCAREHPRTNRPPVP
ncbi:MAG: glycoside hydrolase family 2 protein [Phycisphaerae bacterium]|nr:glycoside hydrolase family 2 protein [Phycisphaerae bacterium]